MGKGEAMELFKWMIMEAGLDWDEEIELFTRYADEVGVPENDRMDMFLNNLLKEFR